MLPRLPVRTSAVLFLFSSIVRALNPIAVQGQDFVDTVTGKRFEIVGVDYQPGGSSGFNPALGFDPLSNGTICLRDAALMQRLGINTIRSYNVAPDLNHDECASIFNAVGIYMILDVNSPLPGGSIVQADPAPSYNLAYLNQTFALLDAFRGYSNTLGFFGANELVNNGVNGASDPPYIRAVQRDLKQYLAARGGRQIPVGYSATDVFVPDTLAYLQCNISADDLSRSDFFGLNDYSWCGNSDPVSSSYVLLQQQFSNSTIPAFFSEYGCNKVEPRIFTEVPYLYGPNMTSFSGGLVYEYTQGTDNYGLVQVNADASVQLLVDYNNLQAQYARLNLTLLQTQNSTASNLQPQMCDPSLISAGSAISNNFNIPDAPDGTEQLISSGVNGNTGTFVSVTQTSVPYPVLDINGNTIANLAITPVANNMANAPTAASGTIITASTGVSVPTTGATATSGASVTSGSSATGTSKTAATAATSSTGAAVAVRAKDSFAGIAFGSLLIWFLG